MYLDLVTVTCGALSIDNSRLITYHPRPVNGSLYPVYTEAEIHCRPRYGIQGSSYPGTRAGSSICMANGSLGYWNQPPQCIKSNEHLSNIKYHFRVFHETPLE